jgi:hypothetical protein
LHAASFRHPPTPWGRSPTCPGLAGPMDCIARCQFHTPPGHAGQLANDCQPAGVWRVGWIALHVASFIHPPGTWGRSPTCPTSARHGLHCTLSVSYTPLGTWSRLGTIGNLPHFGVRWIASSLPTGYCPLPTGDNGLHCTLSVSYTPPSPFRSTKGNPGHVGQVADRLPTWHKALPAATDSATPGRRARWIALRLPVSHASPLGAKSLATIDNWAEPSAMLPGVWLPPQAETLCSAR